MSEVGEKWRRQDQNFRRQIDSLMIQMETGDKRRVAAEAGMNPNTFYTRYAHPGTMKKREERQIASVFRRYGMVYDPTMGEGVRAC
jgi:hypothetical protein